MALAGGPVKLWSQETLLHPTKVPKAPAPCNGTNGLQGTALKSDQSFTGKKKNYKATVTTKREKHRPSGVLLAP